MIYDRDPGGSPEFTPCQDWEPGTVLKVGGCGAGCLLIHRRVLQAIGGDWFSEITRDGRVFGEDLSFCVRAAGAGFGVHADTGARAGHVKTTVVGMPGSSLDGQPAAQLARLT